jgi:putative membrane protein
MRLQPMAAGDTSTDRPLLSAAEEEAVRAAVADAERVTGAEIVTWVVETCDPHPEAAWKGAAAGALVTVVVAWATHFSTGGWGGMLAWAVVPALAGALLGFLLGSVPAAKRWLVDDDLLDRRVRTTAEAAFLRGEVFATRERTGVLLFVALAEHRVVVLGDTGINAKVDPAEWQAIADEVVGAIRRGDTAGGLCRGVAACGRLLAARGVARSEGDVNELPDEPRLGDRR